MTILTFKGFGGVRLEAEAIGDENDPTILLVHGAGQTRAEWHTVADALVQAGRRVVSLDLRGHGGSEWPESGRYDLEAHIEDLRAVAPSALRHRLRRNPLDDAGSTVRVDRAVAEEFAA